jgi:hypothetical protein
MRPAIRGTSLLLAALLLALIGAHLFAFGLLSTRLALPAATLGAGAFALLAAHLGLLGPLSGWLRRRFHPGPDDGADH